MDYLHQDFYFVLQNLHKFLYLFLLYFLLNNLVNSLYCYFHLYHLHYWMVHYLFRSTGHFGNWQCRICIPADGRYCLHAGSNFICHSSALVSQYISYFCGSRQCFAIYRHLCLYYLKVWLSSWAKRRIPHYSGDSSSLKLLRMTLSSKLSAIDRKWVILK